MANALIWGAAGGIGRALTQTFAAKGHTVVAVSRHSRGLESLTPYVVIGDATDPQGVAAAVQRAAELASPFKAGLEALVEVIRSLSPERVAQAILQAWDEGREGSLDL